MWAIKGPEPVNVNARAETVWTNYQFLIVKFQSVKNQNILRNIAVLNKHRGVNKLKT